VAVADGRHARVHPLLHFTERDVWEATRAEGVPVNPLYFSRYTVGIRVTV
jgi:3'-phosphoadenosine 5'-phosphosulfate sulfotransferase (PAPS reductase)/FAD synthetase